MTRLAVLAGILVTVAAAQPFSLGGLVVNSSTGQPVSRAVVLISGGGGHVRRTVSAGSTFSDPSGRFRFDGLAPGRYLIRAAKPQFLFNEGAAPVELKSSREDLTLRLTPLGVITGKVVDQNGEPVRGANVIALSVQIDDGLRKYNTVRNVSTDDRGIYRLWNLQPGRYFIKALGRTGGTNLYAGDNTPQYFADQTFGPAYFGGAASVEDAAPIQIDAGTEAQAGISVTLEPAFKIRGSLANFTARRTVRFELLKGEEDFSAGHVAVNGDTGRFEIQYAPAGSFVLRAIQDDASGEVPVNINTSDVGGIEIALAGTVDVKGMTKVIGANSTEDDSRAGCSVGLETAGRRSRKSYNSAPGKLGDFTLSEVMPGTYRVRLNCFGGYVQSVVAGTQNLAAEPLLTVPAGGMPVPIEVVVKRGGGQVQGSVAVQDLPERSRIDVLFVPQFETPGPVAVEADRADNNDTYRFAMEDLAPGTYRVYAFLNHNDIEYRNPRFLQSLSGGVEVRVEDGGSQELKVTEVIR